MTLKYKVGDVVVLAENVDQNWNKTFVPGVAVKIYQLCDHNSNDEHYTVSLVSDPSDYWYIMDKEINHETTALLQTSNESGFLVQKFNVENDDISEERAYCVSGNNARFERGELPPIGTICEHEPDAFSDQWKTVEVLAHREFKNHPTGLLVVFATEDDVSFSSGECFRPIKTAEQIAEEVRKKAINEMESAVKGYGSWEICADLYDAGYRLAGEGVQHGN